MLRAVFALAIATLFSVSRTGHAQAPEPGEDPPPAVYMTLIQEAVAESAAERWVEARGLFREAQQVYPNARALRGIGMTSFELRDYIGAYLALSAALAETRRALDFEQRAQVEALLTRISGLIGRYTVTHLGDSAVVSVDGVRQTLDPGGYVLMTAGEHRVTVVVPDRPRATGSWIVRGGELEPLPIEPPSLDLEPEAVADVATELDTPRSPVVETPPHDTGVQRGVGWVSIGTGAALFVVGTALVRVGRTDVAFLEGADDGTVWDDVERLYERSPRFVRGGTALLVLGSAAAVTGVVLVIRAGTGDDDDDDDDEDDGERAASRELRPHVQARVAPSGAQLEVTW